MKQVNIGYELSDFVNAVEHMTLVYRKDLSFGDTVHVRTLNSLYIIQVWGKDVYGVTGGWFDRHGYSMKKIKINGCTWGGSAIKQDVVAGRGLCLEFSGGLRTSWIVDVAIVRPFSLN